MNQSKHNGKYIVNMCNKELLKSLREVLAENEILKSSIVNSATQESRLFGAEGANRSRRIEQNLELLRKIN